MAAKQKEEISKAPKKPLRHWEFARQLAESVPEEELANLPQDGASNYRAYLYGLPQAGI